MTHNAEHVIIHFATPVEVAKVKTRAGVAAGALLLVGLVTKPKSQNETRNKS